MWRYLHLQITTFALNHEIVLLGVVYNCLLQTQIDTFCHISIFLRNLSNHNEASLKTSLM